jgi:transcriptional regulator with XRE-family HTH domain
MRKKNEATAFGTKLREIRTSRGVTLAELAKFSGVHTSYIAKIEVGELPPPMFDKVVLMALKLNSRELWDMAQKAVINALKQGVGQVLRRLERLDDETLFILFGDYWPQMKDDLYGVIKKVNQHWGIGFKMSMQRDLERTEQELQQKEQKLQRTQQKLKRVKQELVRTKSERKIRTSAGVRRRRTRKA